MTLSILVIKKNSTYEIDYTNHKGEREVRTIIVSEFVFESNEFHSTPQVMIHAYCCSRRSPRTFAASGIHSMREIET